MVLIEVTVKVTGDADLLVASELVAKVGDSLPVTSTC
jgi:hypothetical protein